MREEVRSEGSSDRQEEIRRAERAVLGSVLLDNRAFYIAKQHLEFDDFLLTTHQTLFGAMGELVVKRSPIDVITLAPVVKNNPQLMAYIVGLVEDVPTAANVEHYARVVADAATRRRLHRYVAHLSQQIDRASDLQELLTVNSRQLAGLLEKTVRGRPVHVGEVAQSVYEEIERAEEKGPEGSGAIPTGFPALDEHLGCIEATDLVLVGARSSMGKTSFALQMALAQAQHTGRTSLFFSLETTRAKLVRRYFAQQSGVPLNRLRAGRVKPEEWNRLGQAARTLEKAGVWIDDSKGQTVTDIKAKTRSHSMQHGDIGAIYVDFVQLIKGERQYEKRHEELAATAIGLKNTAEEFSAPVIALSQINRGVESRTNKRPTMSDLKESGGLEEAADLILLLYREDYYDPGSKRSGTAEVIIGKARDGRRGTVALGFDPECVRFS